VAEAAHPDANIIFGAVIDDTLGDEVKVTVIAAGFDSGQLPYKKVDVRREDAPPVEAPLPNPANGAPNPANATPNPANGRPNPGHGAPNPGNGAPAGAPPREREPAGRWPLPSSGIRRTPVNLDDELDVPDFLKS